MKLTTSAASIGIALTLATFAHGDVRAKNALFNPVGHWDKFEKIIHVNVPVRGTLREVLIDKESAAVARRTGELPYGTKIVMKDFNAVHAAGGGFRFEDHKLVAGKATTVLIQQKERGFGRIHPKHIRTGDWDFAIYTPAGKPIPINSETSCMPCHHRFEKWDYTFIVKNYFTDPKQAR